MYKIELAWFSDPLAVCVPCCHEKSAEERLKGVRFWQGADLIEVKDRRPHARVVSCLEQSVSASNSKQHANQIHPEVYRHLVRKFLHAGHWIWFEECCTGCTMAQTACVLSAPTLPVQAEAAHSDRPHPLACRMRRPVARRTDEAP